MLKIEIKSTEVVNKSGTAARSGKPYSINEQSAYFHQPGKEYPIEINITLQDGQNSYAPGFYDLDESSFFVGRFGSLECRPVLKPIKTVRSA